MPKTRAQRRKERSRKDREIAQERLARIGQATAPSQRWAAIADKLHQEDLEAAAHPGDPGPRAQRAINPAQRSRPHTIEPNGIGVAARMLQDALDYYHARGQLGRGDDNDRRYLVGKWFRDLWQFVMCGHVKCVNLEATPTGGGDAEIVLQRKIDARKKIEATLAKVPEHRSVLERVLLKGQFVDREGRDNAKRMVPLKDALDDLEKVARK